MLPLECHQVARIRHQEYIARSARPRADAHVQNAGQGSRFAAIAAWWAMLNRVAIRQQAFRLLRG